MTLHDFLGAERLDGGSVRFSLGRDLHGAFGGAFGGIVAACALVAVRDAAPGRLPVGLDVRFLRGLPAGEAIATASVVHAGRSLTVVAVDVQGPDGRHSVRATASLVDPAALHPLDHRVPLVPLPATYDEAPPWARMPGREIPILDTLSPRILGRVGNGIATAMRLPFTPTEDTTAEACCFAADICVGPPVAAACVDNWVPHPNPDLSLRFASGATVTSEVIGVGTVQRIVGGSAVVDVQVRSDDDVVAVGVATSLLHAVEGVTR